MTKRNNHDKLHEKGLLSDKAHDKLKEIENNVIKRQNKLLSKLKDIKIIKLPTNETKKKCD